MEWRSSASSASSSRIMLSCRGLGRDATRVRIDWKRLQERSSRNVIRPFEHDSQYLRELVLAIRNLHFDLVGLPLPLFRVTKDRELSGHLINGLKLLRATLDVKLHDLRKVKAPTFEA